LYEAYDFLRRLEHILQIENGLQTHLVPEDRARRSLIARRLGMDIHMLDLNVEDHTQNVHQIFDRVFDYRWIGNQADETHDDEAPFLAESDKVLKKVQESAPRFLPIFQAHREALKDLPNIELPFPDRDYLSILSGNVVAESDFGKKLQALRVSWYPCLIEIVVFDAYGKLKLTKCKELQTRLAEASIAVALKIAAEEVQKRYDVKVDLNSFAVLALGKLGSGGVDYDSDLDLVFVYDDLSDVEDSFLPTHSEHFARLVEIFTNILSSITRDGHLYRVDLRLRPYGSDGPLIISRSAIVEYFTKDAAIWELLAYANLRASGGNLDFASACEMDLRDAIHERTESIDPIKLAAETRSIRDKLEKQNASRRSGEIDIKFGAGGLLDVYFSARYLQLRHNYIEGAPHRSTPEFLRYLIETRNCVEDIDALKTLQKGYEHLTSLDHSLRVLVGRSAVLSKQIFERHFKPQDADSDIGRTIANLNFVRLEIRAAYDEITTRNNGPGDS
jgi:glutamine synthetase adenylyltransferase